MFKVTSQGNIAVIGMGCRIEGFEMIVDMDIEDISES